MYLTFDFFIIIIIIIIISTITIFFSGLGAPTAFPAAVAVAGDQKMKSTNIEISRCKDNAFFY